MSWLQLLTALLVLIWGVVYLSERITEAAGKLNWTLGGIDHQLGELRSIFNKLVEIKERRGTSP